jgi:hypothetical protein
MAGLSTELNTEFGPRTPREDDPRRRDSDWPGKRIDESTTPLPGETDYSDDDDTDNNDDNRDDG